MGANMDESFVQMRDFIMASERLNPEHEQYDEPALMETRPPPESSLLEDLNDIVFKLRAFTESREGELGLGVELGMQRAADMIESAIKRHHHGD
jgi:hypothetical protein